jgi:hypothetical protein
MSSFLELSGGVSNFAGSFDDYLLQIRDAIIVGMNIRHENHCISTDNGSFCIPTRTTVDISLILSDNGMILTKDGDNNKNLVRNKFVSDCTVEELLVAIQAKITAV